MRACYQVPLVEINGRMIQPGAVQHPLYPREKVPKEVPLTSHSPSATDPLGVWSQAGES